MTLQRAMPIAAALLLLTTLVASPAADARAHRHAARPRAAAGAAAGPDLRSSAALILAIEPGREQVLFARAADQPAPIASVTKLMTSLVVREARQPLDEVLEITSDDRSRGKGAFSRLAIGARATRGDLMHLALMSSENRAAHALGRNYPGGLEAAVRAMNAKAAALGMKQTHFVDPVGLSPGNVASPTDLARLVIAAGRDPVIRSYSTDPHYEVRNGRRMLDYFNTNGLVRHADWDIVVQKTGFIAEAGECLVMQAHLDGRELVIVLLNSFGKYTRVADAQRLRRWLQTSQGSAAATTTVAADQPGQRAGT
jgi:D-alanyl-D-alanine endopeptidase (penicillin-binding protein 7)